MLWLLLKERDFLGKVVVVWVGLEIAVHKMFHESGWKLALAEEELFGAEFFDGVA